MAELGDPVERFTSGEPTGVNAEAIERELAALWRASSAGEGEHAVTRACLWNLVVKTVGDDELARAKQLVDTIAPAVPARMLLLGHEPAPPEPGRPEVEAWVSANCQIAPGGGKLLCSEEISIATRGPGILHLAPLVQALAVPDVPLTLLWMGGVPTREQHELAFALCRGAERLIVDSGDLHAHRQGSLAELVRVCQSVQPCSTIDLAWLRLLPLRLLFASFFDQPVGAAPLRGARKLTLEVAPRGVRGASLLAGWLAARLGWGRMTAAGSGWRASRLGGEVAIELTVKDGDAGRDGIWQVALDSEDGSRHAIIDAGPDVIRLEGTHLPDRVLAAPERSDPELMVAALGARGMDPLFREALARAVELSPADSP